MMFAECECNLQLMVVGRQVLGERLFRFAMQRSFYGHFVAGATEAEVARSAAALCEPMFKAYVLCLADYLFFFK